MNRLSQFTDALDSKSVTSNRSTDASLTPQAALGSPADFSRLTSPGQPDLQAHIPCGSSTASQVSNDHEINTGPSPVISGGSITEADHARALEVARICEQYLALIAQGNSLRMAAYTLGRSPSWFSGDNSPVARYQRGGVAALLPERRAARAGTSDITRQIEGLGWFIPAARHFYLLTNRTWTSGSVPEAIRRTISLPHVPVGWGQKQVKSLLLAVHCEAVPTCPEELRELILGRERNGLPLVPERIARQVTVSAATVRLHRNPGEFALDYLNTPGGMRMIVDPATGESRRVRAMEIVEADDATINFPVCVPWTLGGTPSSDKFGVMVGRFQWLVFIDVGTSQVLQLHGPAPQQLSRRGYFERHAHRLPAARRARHLAV